jgi:hypothetical protein
MDYLVMPPPVPRAKSPQAPTEPLQPVSQREVDEPVVSSFGIAMDSLFGEPYALFQLLHLHDYVDSAIRLGYDDASDLVHIPSEELDALVRQLVHSQTGKFMLPAHASRLRRGLLEGRRVLLEGKRVVREKERALKSTNHRLIPFPPLCN